MTARAARIPIFMRDSLPKNGPLGRNAGDQVLGFSVGFRCWVEFLDSF